MPRIYPGKYILRRVISLPSPKISIVLADPSGIAISVEIRNHPILPISLGPPRPEHFEAVFPINSIFAIKEPFLAIVSLPKGRTRITIKVESPTDLVRLYPDDPLVQGVEWMCVDKRRRWTFPEEEELSILEWKEKGNKVSTLIPREVVRSENPLTFAVQFYRARQYLQALDAFSTGIRLFPKSSQRHYLYLNRSATNLNLERYSDALSDAESAVSILKMELRTGGLAAEQTAMPLLEKAYVRVARSYYGLRRWSESQKAFEECLTTHPESTDAKAGLAKVRLRLDEQSSGMYDWFGMYQESHKIKNPRLDVADFVGPVEVKESYGRERGLFVTRDVKAGEVVLVSKAVDVIHSSDLAAYEVIVTYDLNTQTIDMHSGARLRSALAYRMYHDPSLVRELDKLDSGPGRGKADDVSPVKDDVPVEAQVAGERAINIARLDNIISSNAFRMQPVMSGDFKTMSKSVAASNSHDQHIEGYGTSPLFTLRITDR